MSKSTPNKTIEFLRIGNPWLVGKNVNRIVPIYALHNVLAPDFEREPELQSIKDLALDAERGLVGKMRERVVVGDGDSLDLESTVYGLLAPERRIFHDKKKGGASRMGALFPMVAGLVSSV